MIDEAPAQGQGTEQQASWYSNESFGFAPEDVGFIQNKGWNDTPAKMLKSYRELEKSVGVAPEYLVKLPKEANDAEGWARVYNKLGRPENVDGYGEFKMPEGVQGAVSAERVKWADGVMHKLGLTKAQRDGLMAETAKYESTSMQGLLDNLTAKQDAELAGLKKEWGSAYAEREELGRRAVRQFLPGDEDTRVALMSRVEEAIGTAAMLKMFANIGDNLLEDKTPMGDGQRSYGYTREQALSDKQELISSLQADPQRLSNYNKGVGPDFDKMQRLLKIIANP